MRSISRSAPILSNAEFRELLLDGETPDIGEVRDILADIKRDDLRASEVILRLRGFLKKAPVEPQEVNINEVVREVFEFASAQASVQRVILEQRLESMPLIIRGYLVQLQQVVLNLLSNAIDAVSPKPGERFRKVTARTKRLDGGLADILDIRLRTGN